jgi:hypothetical protein
MVKASSGERNNSPVNRLALIRPAGQVAHNCAAFATLI